MKTVRNSGVTDNKRGSDYKSEPVGEYLKLFLLSVLEFIFITTLIYVYNELFPINGMKLSIGISFYYYIILVLPFAIILWNTVFVKVLNKKNKYFLLGVLIIFILYYWIGAICDYPYRVSFTILISIVTLSIGNIFANFVVKSKKQ